MDVVRMLSGSLSRLSSSMMDENKATEVAGPIGGNP